MGSKLVSPSCRNSLCPKMRKIPFFPQKQGGSTQRQLGNERVEDFRDYFDRGHSWVKPQRGGELYGSKAKDQSWVKPNPAQPSLHDHNVAEENKQLFMVFRLVVWALSRSYPLFLGILRIHVIKLSCFSLVNLLLQGRVSTKNLFPLPYNNK